MARFKHLEVYQLSYRFTKMVYQTKLKVPKTLKNDLGQMIFESALRVTKGIVIANGSIDKTKTLNFVFLEIDVIWTFLRLLYDLKGISKGEFQVLSEVLTDISDQIQKWLNWSKENNKKSSESKARIK
jgi:hypothetical protein